jgi:hypothetical protein
LYAQAEKFGKVDESVLKMTSYPQDSTADAVILFDVGSTRLEFNQNKFDFELTHERHIRIKIFNKNAYDWADGQIVYYAPSGTRKESISGLKGYTHLICRY